MVEVFKTNVQETTQAEKLMDVLSKKFPHLRVNFDLDDSDKILRVEGDLVSNERIIEIISTHGYQCHILE
jgi:hypothetical protein